MSISADFKQYISDGGGLSWEDYYLGKIRDSLGYLINTDPENLSSDIGKIIFENLDCSTAVAFTQVSKGLHERSSKRWFIRQARQVICKYVQKETSYKDFIKSGGWKDFVIVSAKLAGLALTVGAGIKASIHYSRIPEDAPTKKITVRDPESDTSYEVTAYDHPEMDQVNSWCTVCALAGTITVCGIVGHGLYSLLKEVEIEHFFSKTEQELVEASEPNWAFKGIHPEFYEWKMNKMKENLCSNPPNWQEHPELQKMICPLSNDFMLFPVKDRCGHYFDYRSIRAHQLQSSSQPLICPISKRKENKGLSQLEFDKSRFDFIQRCLREPSNVQK